MSKAGVYFRTLRYLRISQIFHLILHRLHESMGHLRLSVLSNASSGGLSDHLPLVREAQAALVTRAQRHCPYLDSKTVEVFGRTYRTNEEWSLWTFQSMTMLEKYNLHYFDLIELKAARSDDDLRFIETLLKKWIEMYPRDSAIAWDPYPTSLRVVNWCFFLANQSTPDQPLLFSLREQANWLLKNLERHLLGNHLFANLKALLVAALFFEDGELHYTRASAEDMFRKELSEQLNEDYGHFELSPMYHAIILNDLIEVADLFKTRLGEIPSWLSEPIRPMLTWLVKMSFSENCLASFNDTAQNIAAKTGELVRYAENVLNDSLATCLQDEFSSAKHPFAVRLASGYLVLRAGDLKMICDAAEVGASYIPGHAHADSTSIEVAWMQSPLIVHQGTSSYQDLEVRKLQRASQAHNVTVINEKDSSEVWGAFRVGARARAGCSSLSSTETSAEAEVWHDGYRKELDRSYLKRYVCVKENLVRVRDRWKPKTRVPVSSYLHFHPDAKVQASADGLNKFRIDFREKTMELLVNANLNGERSQFSCSIEEYLYAPDFGARLPAQRVFAHLFCDPKLDFELTFEIKFPA